MVFASCYADELEQYYRIRSVNLSNSAQAHELCYLKRFDRFLCSHDLKKGSPIKEDLITEWLSSLKGKSSSVENEAVVIRQFLRFLGISGVHVFIPGIPKVRDDYEPYIFSDDELDRIFSSADNIKIQSSRTNPYTPLEFPVIIRLLFCCGLRIGETLRLKTSDVDLDKGILHMIHTKGNKERIVPMDRSMTDILSDYCMAMGLSLKSSGWLFPEADRDRPMSDGTVKYYFKSILSKNGIELKNRRPHERGPCLHCLRHVFAFKSFADAQRTGKPLDDVMPYLSICLGHDSLNETQKYLKFSSEMYPAALDDFGSFIENILPEVDYEE